MLWDTLASMLWIVTHSFTSFWHTSIPSTIGNLHLPVSPCLRTFLSCVRASLSWLRTFEDPWERAARRKQPVSMRKKLDEMRWIWGTDDRERDANWTHIQHSMRVATGRNTPQTHTQHYRCWDTKDATKLNWFNKTQRAGMVNGGYTHLLDRYWDTEGYDDVGDSTNELLLSETHTHLHVVAETLRIQRNTSTSGEVCVLLFPWC